MIGDVRTNNTNKVRYYERTEDNQGRKVVNKQNKYGFPR